MAQANTSAADPLRQLVGNVLAAATAALPGFIGANQNQPTAQNLPPRETRGPEIAAKASAPESGRWYESPVVLIGAALVAVMVWIGTRR
jgi:hypothetical protein